MILEKKLHESFRALELMHLYLTVTQGYLLLRYKRKEILSQYVREKSTFKTNSTHTIVIGNFIA